MITEEEILKQSKPGLSEEEAVELLNAGMNDSNFAMRIRRAADRMSRSEFKGTGELRVQIGLDYAPCSVNCSFCDFSSVHGSVKDYDRMDSQEFTRILEQVRSHPVQAVTLMATADYPLQELLAFGKMARRLLPKRISLVVNYRDLNQHEARLLLRAGFQGAYHAVRLGEGTLTERSVDQRLQTIKKLTNAGISVGSCIEPIGPEHGPEELVDLMRVNRDSGIGAMAAMRKIGSGIEPINFEKLALISAVTRLYFGRTIYSFGVHEPNADSLLSGANLAVAEFGPNPRGEDSLVSLESALTMLKEAGWKLSYRSHWLRYLSMSLSFGRRFSLLKGLSMLMKRFIVKLIPLRLPEYPSPQNEAALSARISQTLLRSVHRE
jgi:biotin synthase